MGIGVGIVADSDPESEGQECLLKGNFLTRENPDFQLIETLLWQPDSGFFLLAYHLERLLDSCRYFHFSVDPAFVEQQLHDPVADCRHSQRVHGPLRRSRCVCQPGRCRQTIPICTIKQPGGACLTASMGWLLIGAVLMSCLPTGQERLPKGPSAMSLSASGGNC